MPEKYPHKLMPVTPKMRQEINDLTKHAGLLNLGITPLLFADATVTNPDGSVAFELGEHKCNSYNRNYYNILCALMVGNSPVFAAANEWRLPVNRKFEDGYLSVKGVSVTGNLGEVFYTPEHSSMFSFSGTIHGGSIFSCSAVNNLPTATAPVQTGIILGSSNAPEDFNEAYRTTDIILNGTTDGTLSYQAPVREYTPNYNAATRTFKAVVKRAFISMGDIDVTVRESMICGSNNGFQANNTTSTGFTYFIERSVLPAPIIVKPGQALTFTYTFEFLYPEP